MNFALPVPPPPPLPPGQRGEMPAPLRDAPGMGDVGMPVRAAIVIPIYNHGEAIAGTVERLLPYGLPIFLVDDGSDAATRAKLAALVERRPALHLFRLPQNQGKGAAVMRGLREAFARDFTHALQIDADGQHEPAAVPAFVSQAEAHPKAVIAGLPQYDASVPASRRYGRYLTHVWVWIETLSLSIGDSMCGCRMYPLAATIRLIDAAPIGERMDFDTDIIVRLVWRGVPVINQPLAVTYPADGISHFDLWRDNLRISWLHARLFFGMLGRLPLLLWRKAFPQKKSSRHWASLAERGAAWGLACVYACYRLLGRQGASLMLFPIVTYFFLTGTAARRASLDYLRRCHRFFGPSPELPREPNRRDALRHFFRFSQAALDKVAAWQGEDLGHLVEPGELADLDRAVRERSGALVIGAHLGNLEMCRALAARAGHRSINAVVHSAHAAKFARIIERANRQATFKLLQVNDFGADTAVLLREKIDAGEWLVIVGDRIPVADNGRVARANFLGAPALFPQGPFVLAHLLQCPVYLLACLREGGKYHIVFDRFAERLELPRKEREPRLAEAARRYAQWLEQQCRRAPFEWFNFYDFWAHASEHRTSSTASDSTLPLPHA